MLDYASMKLGRFCFASIPRKDYTFNSVLCVVQDKVNILSCCAALGAFDVIPK